MVLAALHRGDGGFEQGPRFLFPLLLIALLVFLFTRLRRRRVHHMMGYGVMSPLATLGDRFARGEISKAEFDHRSAVLKGDKEIPPAPTNPAPPAPKNPAPPAPRSDAPGDGPPASGGDGPGSAEPDQGSAG